MMSIDFSGKFRLLNDSLICDIAKDVVCLLVDSSCESFEFEVT